MRGLVGMLLPCVRIRRCLIRTLCTVRRVERGDARAGGAVRTTLGTRLTRGLEMLSLIVREQRRETFERVIQESNQALRRRKLYLFILVRHALDKALDDGLHMLERDIEAAKERHGLDALHAQLAAHVH